VADLSTISVHPDSTMPQNFAVKVTPKLTDNYVYSYDIVSYSPSAINVMVDKMITSSRNLNLKTEGKLATSYVADAPECDVSTVVVKGPSTRVGDISSIQAVVDITGKSANVSEQAEVIVVDSEGKQLEGFEIEPQYVTVKVNIRKEGTVNINQPQTVGTLPGDLQLDSVDWSPKTLDVKGKSGSLEKTQSINLPVIDLSGISSSVSYTYSVKKLLDNTGLTSDTANVTVNVKVSAQTEEGELVPLNIQGSDVSVTALDDSLGYIVDNIDIELKGEQDIIGGLDVGGIHPTINAAGLTKGKHSVTVNLYLPTGVVAVKNSADIIIYDKNDVTERDDLNITPETATETTSSETEEVTFDTQKDDGSAETTVANSAE
jgi:YbbR domain-containing protein